MTFSAGENRILTGAGFDTLRTAVSKDKKIQNSSDTGLSLPSGTGSDSIQIGLFAGTAALALGVTPPLASRTNVARLVADVSNLSMDEARDVLSSDVFATLAGGGEIHLVED